MVMKSLLDALKVFDSLPFVIKREPRQWMMKSFLTLKVKGVGGVKIIVSDFFPTSLMKTTGYSENKMGSTKK